MIILQYHEGFFIRLAAPAAMPAHLGAYSLKKTSWYCCNIIILLGVEDQPICLSLKNKFEFWKIAAWVSESNISSRRGGMWLRCVMELWTAFLP